MLQLLAVDTEVEKEVILIYGGRKEVSDMVNDPTDAHAPVVNREYRYQEFPKLVYNHKTGATKVIDSEEQFKGLGKHWFTSPPPDPSDERDEEDGPTDGDGATLHLGDE